MCGIAGVLTPAATSREQLERNAIAMADSIAYRGPDDHGLWSDADAGVALTHRRLSIVDLSATGHQPMISADGQLIITYNGEIYNFQELRRELEARGVRFRGHSDTEVMLEAFAAYGIDATVKRLIGMFTIGVWDRRERTLTLVRDRLGIKPLYWAKFGELFLFGSELKALARISGLDAAHRPPGGRGIHAAQLYPCPAYDLRGRTQTRAGNNPDAAVEWRTENRAFLECPSHRASWPRQSVTS